MPIYNSFATAADSKDPSKRTPSPDVLRAVGPTMTVELFIPDKLAEYFTKNNLAIPPSIRGNALIDTGASITCVNLPAVKSLGLQPISRATVHTPQGSAIQDIYPVKMAFVGTRIAFNLSAVMGSDLSAQNILALIGRDILARCIIIYNGLVGHFSLSI